ncbi:proteasome subunit beta [Candidatus Pacearchaeota archaeon CG10_big_fil_rev_8_21_14_0_10_32_14]|nr:MAG: proteasome subunit beta [Candidatus Pacearchaeota archaeon CG10_big_fil_rev_8_21_14_0_10_32_14]
MDTINQELSNSILKTGTTILGIVCKDGVVMTSDRQSTAGSIVMNKNSQKTKQINDYILISGTGMVSDIQRVSRLLPAELKLKELKSRTRPTVKQAASLLSNLSYNGIRQPSMIPQQAGFLLGGFNEDGSCQLFSIEPAGSVVEVEDFDANFGSGMPYVLGLLESQYKKGISVKDGIALAIDAVKASSQRDVGSGYGVDVFTITKEGIKKVISQEVQSLYKED